MSVQLIALPEEEFTNLVNEIRDLKNFLKNFRLENTEPSLPEVGGIELAEKILHRSKSWIYKATAENKIPFRKFNSSLIFDRKELEDYLLKNTEDPWKGDIQVNEAIAESARKKLENEFTRKR